MPTTCIDKEVNEYSLLSSDLHAQKNSCLPIFRLPPEILENIFTHGAHDYYEGNHLKPAFCIPHWVNISYVCRHWRNVALNCPTLWTYHSTLSPRWSEELLTRSKQASLKICIYIGSLLGRSKWPRLLEKVLNHAERIEELRLDIPGEVLPTELSLNAPRLQILDICIWGVRHRSEQTFMINNGDTLPLRTLKLTACPLPWNSIFNLGGVTTLFLRDIPSPSQLHIIEFLATLSRMQALTVLHLDRSLASSRGFLSSRAFGAFPKVSLPRLARLFVAGPLSVVVTLLYCINIPVKTQVKLVIGSENSSSVDDYAQLSPALAQRFSQYKDLPSSHPTIRSLAISIGFQWNFTINASELYDYDPKSSMACPPRDCSAPLIIVIGMEQSIPIRDQIMSDICCSIPSTHVQTLHIVNPPYSPNFWRKMLGHLHGLRRMKLSYGIMPDLASLLALAPVEAPGGDITDPTPLVPGLKELELHSITFTCFSGNVISEKTLLDALSTRKAQLTVTQCAYDSEEESDVDEY